MTADVVADVVTVHHLDGRWRVYIDDDPVRAAVAAVDIDTEADTVTITVPARRIEYIKQAADRAAEYGRFTASAPDSG
ncbi:hypothetical protein SAMN05421505_112138 [Sinosporangium album]|uniref:Uncharacterized protein n=1 Tax=Sinosporangium album TaxID=504805 RepID=A0A1G8AFI6_9ACTN|nr:hypothetical protein [Sinosporangium album]SDH19722.1 hypothetical protein SAMN05421505_112138 [Sinosporangium album]